MRANKPPCQFHERNKVAKTRPYALHEVNPAGTKAVLRFYKAHHGTHAETVAEAWKWYRALHADKERAVLKREAERKALREARKRHPNLAHRLAA